MIRTLAGLDPEELDDDDNERYPWESAVDPALVTRKAGTRSTTLWWAGDSPLIDELYGANAERDEADEADEADEE
jgi:hypothetical protein